MGGRWAPYLSLLPAHIDTLVHYRCGILFPFVPFALLHDT